MHAVVVHANLTDVAEATKGLQESVLPMVKSGPGFVGAYFVHLGDGHGLAVQVYETEEQARDGAPPEGTTGPGVTLTKLEFGEVIGSA
jgi:hypothetical protein